MKDWNTLETSAQNEALINEFKGNLFEYQMAFLLAQFNGPQVLSRFLKQFQGNFRLKLSQYETWMRNNDPRCLAQLPVLANQSLDYLKDSLGDSIGDLQEVQLMGKLTSTQDQYKESDILLKSAGDSIPLSLKLCKEQAFVNTKSGGVFSFLEKYFSSSFPTAAAVEQALLNELVEDAFYEMGTQLYQRHGLGRFEGSFDERWGEEYSELPGQLDDEDSHILGSYYHRVINQIHNSFVKFQQTDGEGFLKCLSPVVGMGRKDMHQLTCFHRGIKEHSYELSHIELFTPKDWERESKACSIGAVKKGLASFEILFENMLLQIRVKPMNKFTAKALKINCSVKRKKHGH